MCLFLAPDGGRDLLRLITGFGNRSAFFLLFFFSLRLKRTTRRERERERRRLLGVKAVAK